MSKRVCICAFCVENYRKTYEELRYVDDAAKNIHFAENLYIVWYGAFADSFQKVSNFTSSCWSLVPDNNFEGHISTFSEMAKVRFVCQECYNVWTSMMGWVEFWVYKDPHQYVLSFRLLGQKCNKCQSEKFQTPNWYPEEVEKVLGLVSHRIIQTKDVYGQTMTRRGNPHGLHSSESCEACQKNICTKTRNRNVSGTTMDGCSNYESEEDEIETVQKEKNCTSDYESQDECYSTILRRSISVPSPKNGKNSFFVHNEC